MAVDDWFDPRGTGRAVAKKRRGGSTGGSSSFAEFMASPQGRALTGGDEESGRRSTTFKPGQRPEDMPNLPRRLATYAHGYSYSQGGYPGGVPRYFDGDEMMPGRLPPHNIAAVQRLLVDSGLLDDPRWGFWDASSQEAYQRALSEANGKGVDVQTLLSTYADAAAMAEAEAREPFQAPALQIRQHNMKDLESVFRKSVTELLGVGWSQADISRAAKAFVGEETRIQTEAQLRNIERERQLYETGETDIDQITEVDIPDPNLFIEREAERRDPGGFKATQVATDYAPEFFAALGAGGGRL